MEKAFASKYSSELPTIILYMVGVVGFAPTRHYWQQILSLSRLLNYDIPPYKQFRSILYGYQRFL